MKCHFCDSLLDADTERLGYCVTCGARYERESILSRLLSLALVLPLASAAGIGFIVSFWIFVRLITTQDFTASYFFLALTMAALSSYLSVAVAPAFRDIFTARKLVCLEK